MTIFRRKRVFVERGLQLRFARFVILYMLASCLVTAFVVFYATFAVLSDKLVGIYPQHRLSGIFSRAYFAFFLGLLAAVPILFYAALAFSHRIAGPLPKIYRALDEVGQGNFDVSVTLRKRDELKELADRFNKMVAKLKERESRK